MSAQPLCTQFSAEWAASAATSVMGWHGIMVPGELRCFAPIATS